MDIADIDLSRVDTVKGRGTVGVAKHLCGSATDLALRCIIGTLNDGDGKGPERSVVVGMATLVVQECVAWPLHCVVIIAACGWSLWERTSLPDSASHHRTLTS